MSPIIIYAAIILALIALILAIVAMTKKSSSVKPPTYGNRFTWSTQTTQSFTGPDALIVFANPFVGVGFNNIGNNQIKCSNAGVYYISYQFAMYTSTDSALVYSYLKVNGGDRLQQGQGVVSGGASKDTPYTLSVSAQVTLKANDIITVYGGAYAIPESRVNRIDTHLGAGLSGYITGFQIA